MMRNISTWKRVILYTLLGMCMSVLGAGCKDLASSKLSVSDWSVELTVQPDRSTYLPGAKVFVTPTVQTGEGTIVGDPPIEWTVDEGKNLGDEMFQLPNKEAVMTITACVYGDVGKACDDVKLGVDATPPELTITSPKPADELLSNDNDTVVIDGMVKDTNPDATLRVYANGVEADVQSDGQFTVELPAHFGIKHLDVQAGDGFHDPVHKRFDVLIANAYKAPQEGTTRFDFENAITLRLTQTFFDRLLGGSDLNATASPFEARDLASMIEYILMHLDFSDVIQNPVVSPADTNNMLELNIDGVTVGNPIIDIALADDNTLKLTLTINHVNVKTSGWLHLLSQNFDIDGSIAADVWGTIAMQIQMDQDGEVSSSIDLNDIGVGGLTPHFTGNDGEFFDALINLGTVQTTFRDLVTDKADDLILPALNQIPDAISGLLNSVADQLSGIQYSMEVGNGFPDLTMNLDASLGQLAIHPGADDGYMDLSLDADLEVVGENGPVHGDSPGAAIDQNPDDVPLSNVGTAQIAIRQDVVNGLLHAVWNAGFLDADDVAGKGIYLRPKLPPVLTMAPADTDCQIDDERCDAILQIGQLEIVNGSGSPMVNIFLQAGASVSLTNNQVTLRVVDNPILKVWPAPGANPAMAEFETTVVKQLFDTKLWSAITKMLGTGGALTIPIPIPAFGELGLGAYTTGLSDATLNLDSLQGLEIDSGFVGLSVDLVFAVPGAPEATP